MGCNCGSQLKEYKIIVKDLDGFILAQTTLLEEGLGDACEEYKDNILEDHKEKFDQAKVIVEHGKLEVECSRWTSE